MNDINEIFDKMDLDKNAGIDRFEFFTFMATSDDSKTKSIVEKMFDQMKFKSDSNDNDEDDDEDNILLTED